MQLVMKTDADLSRDEERALRALAAAVYPPAVIPTLSGSDLTWARSERRLLVRDGGRLVAHVDVLTRAVALDGRAMRVGVLRVMTPPRRKAAATRAPRCAARRRRFTLDPALAFALLTCPWPREPFYARRDWQRFGGQTVVAQPSVPIAFTVGAVLVLPLRDPAPATGRLDLRGLPW